MANDHYVPRFYLKNFAVADKPSFRGLSDGDCAGISLRSRLRPTVWLFSTARRDVEYRRYQ